MRLLLVGDLIGNTGPASVNRSLKKYLPKNTLYLKSTGKLFRVLELLIKINQADAVLFSGMSKINIIGFKLSRLLGKKSAYLMHGSRRYETILNQNFNKKSVEIEDEVLKLAPKIICVSEYFMNWFKKNYPEYKDKVTYVNNGIDWDLMLVDKTSTYRDRNTLISVGGGMPRKNILSICHAINKLNQEDNLKLKLIVIGQKGKDTDAIISYPFVEYYEQVKSEEMPQYYQRAQIYIQNSIFETFGLAPIEALINGCDLLISNEVGAKSVFSNLTDNDIIYNPYDINELSNKIKVLLTNSNNKRLINSINKKETSVSSSVNKIIKILQE
jgi:glycosyltransferase involved in cell wall biosynthesis